MRLSATCWKASERCHDTTGRLVPKISSRIASGQSRLACCSGRPPNVATACGQTVVSRLPSHAAAAGRALVLVRLVDEYERLSESDGRLVLDGARLGEREGREGPRGAESRDMSLLYSHHALEAK